MIRCKNTKELIPLILGIISLVKRQGTNLKHWNKFQVTMSVMPVPMAPITIVGDLGAGKHNQKKRTPL